MDEYKVVYSAKALRDLKDIYVAILLASSYPAMAERITKRIRNEIISLREMPERYALVEWEPWASMRMHKRPVGKYVIFYLVDRNKKLVSVVRIFYGGRDIENIAKEEN